MKKSLLPFILFWAAVLFLWSCESSLEDTDPSAVDVGRTDGTLYSEAGGGGSSSGGGNGQGQEPEPGVITAGEWKDLDHWDFWQNLFNEKDYEKMPEYWGFDLQNRFALEIKQSNGQPAIDVPVTLKAGNETIWQAKTDNKGRAELWGNIFAPAMGRLQSEDWTISIDGGNMTIQDPTPYQGEVQQVTYTPNRQVENRAELAFVVDATGSMSDELEYLKTELLDVIQRAKSENPGTSFLTGSVFYRDTEDEYLTRESPFSSDIQTTLSFIEDQEANGGGDFPEAVHTALSKAIRELQWSSQTRARLLFLLLDAPPHYETQIVDEMHDLTQLAAAKGIKIIPITASGIDKETEFLMRFMGNATNGTYVFITNHSGIGNDHLEPSIGEYEVEYLNVLMVRLFGEAVE
ncbi:VWA domain-containing protein [Echinicola jeungdonensis]|uniref:VWA domain-containing protein n=1 Tax=Echinicola jeungdonensis TaxID=709343 RepID=A0ABV5J3Y7_9BACT|nr:vWA domain-containing protein [Echinicola jeungdonensis]MDN3670645.1 VWA domain-containing protein [Echinicola jeungdonensis]